MSDEEKKTETADEATARLLTQEDQEGGYHFDDFVAWLPETNAFIYLPLGGDVKFPGKNVCALCDDEDAHTSILNNPALRVAGMTWAPGYPKVIADTLVHLQGGMEYRPGVHSLNRYKPARLSINDADGSDEGVKPWLDHIKLLYPDDATHIVQWLAWRVQRPEVKIHHALVLGGATRIGKDTLLKPVAYSCGPWNVATVDAQRIMDEPKFTPYLESVICLVNEAKDFGDKDRFAFYERMKPWLGGLATGVLPVADKNVRLHPVVDVVGFVITTNHKARGLYLPEDDARHYVAWSNRTLDDWDDAASYFAALYEWYASGGYENVARFLFEYDLDLLAFSPTSPPPQTDAHHEIVRAYANPKKNALTDILEGLGSPPAVTIAELHRADPSGDLSHWITPEGRNTVAAEMEDAGYVSQGKPGSKSGRWQIGGKRKRTELIIYVKAKLTKAERERAALEVFKREQVRAE
ncbi:MAG TPA: primase-helicase family protein [Candidatus Dormibacteraeota bacterium]|nr:primase-helicase family protein [Candidatus Dormibacteraeota bacterium]